jgi:hypothetical protein
MKNQPPDLNFFIAFFPYPALQSSMAGSEAGVFVKSNKLTVIGS